MDKESLSDWDADYDQLFDVEERQKPNTLPANFTLNQLAAYLEEEAKPIIGNNMPAKLTDLPLSLFDYAEEEDGYSIEDSDLDMVGTSTIIRASGVNPAVQYAAMTEGFEMMYQDDDESHLAPSLSMSSFNDPFNRN